MGENKKRSRVLRGYLLRIHQCELQNKMAETVHIPGNDPNQDHMFRIQEHDLETLIRQTIVAAPKTHSKELDIAKGPLLDLGCGDGLLESILVRNRNSELSHFLDFITGIKGVDLHERRLEFARKNHDTLRDLMRGKLDQSEHDAIQVALSAAYNPGQPEHKLPPFYRRSGQRNLVNYLQGDIKDINKPELYQANRYGIVVVSNVLHWEHPRNWRGIIEGIHYTLKPKGIAMICTNGIGTSQHLALAYHAVLNSIGKWDNTDEGRGYNSRFYNNRTNPLRQTQIDELRETVNEVFNPTRSNDEAIIYAEAMPYTHDFKKEDFIEAVRHYAREELLKPLTDVPYYTDAVHQEEFLDMIAEQLEVVIGKTRRDFHFEQVSNIIIAQKLNGNEYKATQVPTQSGPTTVT